MAAPTLAGFFNGGGLNGVSSGTVGSFTPGTNESGVFGVMLVAIEPGDASPISLSTLTDTQGNSWVKKFTTSGIQGNDGNGLTINDTMQVEVWFCQSGSFPTGGTTFTFTASRTVDNLTCQLTTWNGVNATTPFDPTTTPPTFSVGTSAGNAGASITTGTADTVIFIAGATASNLGSQTASFNGGAADNSLEAQHSVGSWWDKLFMAYKAPGAIETNYPVTFGASKTDLTGLVFAITADAVPPPPVNPARLQSIVIF